MSRNIGIAVQEVPVSAAAPLPVTTIGEYVVIFAGAVICPGVTIGNKAVIAAGAVVTKNVPARAIVAGVPAKVVGYRSITKV